MSWWGWLIIGFGLAGAELLGAEAAYYLIFVGAAAILMGLAALVGLTLPIWSQWVLFATLTITSMVFFRRKLYDRFHRSPINPGAALIGQTVELAADIKPGERSQVRLRGSVWNAENAGTTPLTVGQRTKVVATEGNVLKIEGVFETS